MSTCHHPERYGRVSNGFSQAMSTTDVMDSEDQDENRLYEILNVSSAATISEIRESHRRLSRIFHPDKHTSSAARAQADPRFQEIQFAFEVLSDPHRRAVYDTLGEEGLSIKMEVGQRNMTPDELKTFFFNQARQARVEELDSLVQTRGDTAITVDASSMFGGRVVVEKHLRPGSPIPIRVARPATVLERIDDVRFRGLTLKNSWTIPFTFSSLLADDESTDQPQVGDNPSALTLTGSASISGTRQLKTFGVLAALRHQISPKTTLEASIPLIAPRVFRSRVVHQYSPELFMTMEVSASHFACPPEINLTTGRQITERGIAVASLRSGTPWKLAGWGKVGNAAQYIIGWTRNSTQSDPTGYTVELITGLQALGVAADYNTLFKSTQIKMKASGSVTTGGLGMTIGGDRKITQHSRLGVNVTANSSSLIVRISLSRLGQNFRIPIWISDGLEFDAILYGVILPLGGLIVYEYTVVQPLQEKRRMKKVQQKQEELKDKLVEKEQSAKETVELMRDPITRKQQLSKSQQGLYISSATYGTKSTRIDVTIALAAQLNDQQLVLPRGQRKSHLRGFWDPAYGEKKSLQVEYYFGGTRHYVEVDDKDGLAIPTLAHSL